MSISGTYTESPAVFLRPRPLARTPGSFILLPLLPRPRPVKPLPAEVWSKVLSYVVDDGEDDRMRVPERRALLREKWKLLFVCKSWANVVLPLLYSHVHIFTVPTLEKFVAHLCSSDRRWDSIRRIPYSTPGRWVQMLDLSEIVLVHPTDSLFVDSNLTRLFPLLPFLTSLYLVPEMFLSNRALAAMQIKDGIGELRSLKGIKISVPVGHASTLPLAPSHDALIRLLRDCPRLEQLEIACCSDPVSPEPESITDLDLGSLRDERSAFPPRLCQPHLKFLCLSAVPICQLFFTFLGTPLPELRHLIVTPYSGHHTAQLSALLTVHGRSLISLRINTPRYLRGSMGDRPPPPILISCPELHYLSLDQPLPALTLPAPAQDGELPHTHPLRVLTIPRPNARFLRGVEALLPRLPSLAVVRVRAVRWLRPGVSGKALEAGVQGEMRDWRRKFARRGVRLVDGEWRDPE
ncbi:hypothetical protein BC827DRAFT_461852 [Russula dissimulans]|nr:hypothetical protein BC827DRAFT_461852 [Russula dissimulans]